MNSPLMRLAINSVRGWTWLYTWRMPPAIREIRRAEIESDLWEFQRDAAGDRGLSSALHVLLRLLLGIPDDLGWRVEQAAVAGTLAQRSIVLSARVAGAAVFLCALWVMDADASRRRPTIAVAGPVAVFDQEIEGIMKMRAGNVPHSAGRTLPLLTAGVVAAVGVSMLPQLAAQFPPIAASGPSFEAASVKQNKSGGPSNRDFAAGGRFTARNTPLRTLIQLAYRIQDFQLSGRQDLLNDRFDVVAKAEGNLPVNELQLMLRTLLKDRFKLAVRSETRELQVYALVMARKDRTMGVDLRRSGVECAPIRIPANFPNAPPPPPPPPPGPQAPPGPGADQDPNRFGQGCGGMLTPGLISARKMTMTQFGNLLSRFLSRSLIERTGLTGNFDIDLVYTPDQMPTGRDGGPPPVTGPSDGPSIFTAIQEQLGLKLESTRGPVGVLVIDSVEPPTPD